MERIEHYSPNFGSRPTQWTSPYTTIVSRDAHARLVEWFLLELGLWSLLASVGLLVLASRCLAPVLVIGAILGAAALLTIGLR